MENSQNTTDASFAFSRNFLFWFKSDFPGQKWLKDEYVRCDEATGRCTLNVNFEAAYRAYFPDLAYNGVLERDTPSFYDVGMLIELAYNELIRPESRDAFAQLVNLRLREFNAPLKFTPDGFISLTNDAPPKLTNRVTMAHKIAAALFILIVVISVLRGC